MFDGPLLPALVNTSSPRVGAGLGTIARIVATGETVYRRRLSFAEAEARIRGCWEPSTMAALSGLLRRPAARFGFCLLVDWIAISMPAHPPRRQPAGYRAGRCAWHRLRPARHTPGGGNCCRASVSGSPQRSYAGGYVTRALWAPARSTHALQIEIAGALHGEQRIERAAGFRHSRREAGPTDRRLATTDWGFLRP